MAAIKVSMLKCVAFFTFITIQLTRGVYESPTKTCTRRLPFNLKTDSRNKEALTCDSLNSHTKSTSKTYSLTQKSVRRRRSLLIPGLPLPPPLLLPPIIPKLPLIPLPLLPLPLQPLPKLKKHLKPLKVPILGKRSILSKSVGSKIKPIKVAGLDLKAGKRRILDHLIKLKRKGSITTEEFLRFRKLLLR